MKKYKDYLAEKERAVKEDDPVFEYTDNHDLNEMRQLVEDMTRWMSVGSNAVKTSQKMLHDFKDVMKRANAIVRDNKLKRGDY
tara:strand:- start:3675 stop:3923 length:249 start_codon:yes stop_codon:yes gene_type:complete